MTQTLSETVGRSCHVDYLPGEPDMALNLSTARARPAFQKNRMLAGQLEKHNEDGEKTKKKKRRGGEKKRLRRCWWRRNKMLLTIYLFQNGRCRLEFIIQGPLFHIRHDLCGHQCARVNRMAVRSAARFVTAVSLRDWGSAQVPFRAHRALPVHDVRSAVFYVVGEAAAVYQLLLPFRRAIRNQAERKWAGWYTQGSGSSKDSSGGWTERKRRHQKSVTKTRGERRRGREWEKSFIGVIFMLLQSGIDKAYVSTAYKILEVHIHSWCCIEMNNHVNRNMKITT